MFLSCRLPPRHSAGEAAGGGEHCGADTGDCSKEHPGTGPVGLGLLQPVPELPAGVAAAHLHQTEPWTQSRCISNTCPLPLPNSSLAALSLFLSLCFFTRLADSGVFGRVGVTEGSAERGSKLPDGGHRPSDQQGPGGGAASLQPELDRLCEDQRLCKSDIKGSRSPKKCKVL